MNRLGRLAGGAVIQSDMTPAAGAPMQRLLINGTIHQAAGADASWLRISGDTIVDVGSGAPPALDADVQVVDLKGKYVMPGLHDSHLHTAGLGSASLMVNLGGCKSVAELKQRVRDHAKAHP